MTAADTSPLSILVTAAATAAMARGPHFMASAGFGPGEDPRPMLAWYAIGGIAFLALFVRNVVGTWRDLKGKGSNADLEKRITALERNPGTPAGEHKEDIGDVYGRIETVRTELDTKITTLTNSTASLHADLAATRAETRTLNASVRQLVQLIKSGHHAQ